MKTISHIFSIGHGNKSIETLILELKSFDIKYLIDIRSKPYSKYNPHFNQEILKHFVEKENTEKRCYLQLSGWYDLE
jgi:uncharacterized protein (DUF488 family)